MSLNPFQRKLLVSSAILKVAFVSLPTTAYAVNWYVEPSISLSAGYDDNPLLLSSDSTSATGESFDIENQSYLTLSPTVLIASETDRSSLHATFSSNVRKYNDSRLDSELIAMETGYRRSNLTNEFGVDFSYIEDSTLQTEFLDTGEFELDVDRTELALTPSFTSQISTVLSSESTLTFRKVSFDSIITTLTEFEEAGASFQLTSATTERLDLNTSVRFLSYKPTDVVLEGGVVEQRSYALVFGGEYSLQENLTVNISVGPQFTESFTQDGASSDSTSTVYSLGFAYTGFSSAFNGSASRDISSSALGELVETDIYTIDWSRPEVYGGELNSSLAFSSRSNSETILAGRDSYEFQIGYNKPLSTAFRYSLLYSLRKEDISGDIQGGESNTVTLQLQYNWTRKSFSN